MVVYVSDGVIREDHFPRNEWKLGRIAEEIEAKNSLVWKVKI